MANDNEFQEQIRQLGKLVTEFDQLPESPAKIVGKQLVQLLMDVHGAGLERMMEIVFDSGAPAQANPGQAMIDKLGQDSLVGSLLLLYSLHPDGIETRVQKAVERIRPRLRKLASAIELVSTQDGAVQVRLAVSSHSCGSSAKDLRAIVEDGIYEFAPDIASLEIFGLDDPPAPGFVALETLMRGSFAPVGANGRHVEREGAD